MQYYRVENSNFTENGNIKLQPSSAILKMELNGICEIEIVHPYDEEGRWKQIERFGVIKSPVCYIKNEQLFRIYDIDKGMFGLTVKARHIFFDLVRHTILDNRAVNTTGKGALDIIFNGTRFTGHSDIDTYNTAYFVRMNSIQAINGDKDNTFMKRWGGEIFPDNFDIHINKKIGGDYGVKVKYSKNMIDVNLSENTDEIVTRAYPVAADGIMLPEKYIDSPLINKYPLILENFIEMNDLKLKDKEHESDDDEGFETEAELYQAMRNRVKNLFDEGLDKPKISGSVEMAVLEDTDDYKYFTNLVNVAMGDTVEVEHLDIGINTKTRCVGIEWDILTKKYNAVTLGELESDYFDSKDVTTDKLDSILNNNGTVNSSMLEGVMNAMDTKFKALRDVAQPQEVRAILFEDRIKGSRTYGAMCLGSMGFEIASERTPDDKAWIWKTFGTGQGFFADWLVGKLRTVLIENMDGSFSIDLNKSGGALFKNNGKEAIEIRNNAANFYNWAKAGELIGSLTSLIRGDNKDEPLIGLVNERNSAVSIGYKDPKADNIYPSYVEFDKYNILNNYKPIRIYENVSLGEASLFFGANDTGELYSTSDGDIAFKTKHAFGTVDKDTRKWTSFLDSDNVFFAHWKTGEKYFSVNPSRFSMPGFWRGDDGEIWSGVTLNVDKNFHTNGNITCSGKKNRMVKTEHYGERLQNAIESPECWFIDYGEGKLVNGKAEIKIDPIHLETINTDYKYIVRAWSDDGTRVWCRKSNRHKKHFIVEGKADCDFEYEIIAKQKGYENVRLEEVVKEDSTSFSMSKNIKKEG